jgi:hypothetical protein
MRAILKTLCSLEKNICKDNNSQNKMSGFSIIFFLLQITTIFSNQYSNNAVINNYYFIFSLFIILELFLNNHLFIYYIVVIVKTIFFVLAFKNTNITANGFFAFPLMQIGFLYNNLSQYFGFFYFSTIIHILTAFFLLLLFYISNQYMINPVIFYSICIFAMIYLTINYFKYYYTDKRFTIHIKTTIKFIEYLQSIKLPPSGLVLLALLYLPFIDNSYLVIKIILCFSIFIPLFTDIKNFFSYKKAYNIKTEIEISWLFLLVYFFITLFIYCILQINLSSELYQKVIENTINIVTPLAIVNITAVFILLQMNYNKFNSTYLTKQLLKSPLLVFITFLPSFILFFNFKILDKNLKYDFLSSVILLLSFSSSVFLIIYSKTLLETNAMLRKLLTKVTIDEFENYKENIVSMNETKIDAVLKIIQAVIKTNDTPRVQSTFYSLSFWINENIDKIKYEHRNYLQQTMNKFNSFLNTINHELLDSNNIIMHDYYLNSIRDMIIPSITSDNYIDYKIIYLALHEYLIKRLEKKQEEYAEGIYHLIYNHCSNIFFKLKIKEENHDYLFHDLFDFEEIFLDGNISKIINTAIEYKCLKFLKNIRLYNDLFINSESNNFYEYWDDKVKDVFVRTKSIIQKKNIYLLDNGDFLFYINCDFELFLKSHIRYKSFSEYAIYNAIINYVINELTIIYNHAISINRRFNDFDFELLWQECLDSINKNDLSRFKLFYFFYTFLLDKIFDKEYKGKNPDKGMVYNLFSRVLQIIELNKGRFNDIILDKYNKLKDKYPNLNELEKTKPRFELIEKIDYYKLFEI